MRHTSFEGMTRRHYAQPGSVATGLSERGMAELERLAAATRDSGPDQV
jgi:hypothetical protein